MSVHERVTHVVEGMKLVLRMQEKDLEILEASDECIRVRLKGFCSECECSQDYVEGLRETFSGVCPSVELIDILVG